MLTTRLFLLLAAALLAACTGGAPGATSTPPAGTPPTGSPTSEPTASGQPSGAPSHAPASLDPSLSDAGIIGQVTLSNDSRADRDGTYTVVGVAGDGSDCSPTLDGTEFIAVAWHDDAPDGQIHRFGVSVAATDVPASDGVVEDATGGVSFDFVSESGFGTQYTARPPDDGNVSIDISRDGDVLRFDFEGVTSAGEQMTGTMLCSEAG